MKENQNKKRYGRGVRVGWVIMFIGITVMPMSGCYSQDKDNVRQNINENVTDNFLWDFGKVKEGAVLKHDFVFKNESKTIVNIKDINTSCGCTLSQIKKKKLLPGESTIIGVQFESKGYSGEVIQYIFVNTDSLDNPIVRYIIKAEVVK